MVRVWSGLENSPVTVTVETWSGAKAVAMADCIADVEDNAEISTVAFCAKAENAKMVEVAMAMIADFRGKVFILKDLCLLKFYTGF